ncbi:MAG: MFS transporter [Pseudomonadota bacterium]|jgi:PAT family beta-lactamase induction signal transducer AmpG|nr:MAG: permease [Pseudomonadota bacterium]
MADAPEKPRQDRWEFIRALRDRRVFCMLLLGAAAGLPFFLIFDTLSAWLREAGLSLQTITVFALATLSYALKFVWAPVIDRVRLPLLHDLLGKRRSWMVLMQVLIMLGLWLIAGSDPVTQLGQVALLAVLVGFCGATQDIAMDAWRIEVVPESQYGTMAAAYQWGYRIAMIVAGALPLFLADAYGWNFSYGVMAACMLVAVAASLAAPREQSARPPAVVLPEGLPRRPVREAVEWALRLVVLASGALLAGSGLAADATFIARGWQWLGASAEQVDALLSLWSARETGIFIQFPAVVVGLALMALACIPLPGVTTRPGVYLSRAYADPLADFFRRFGRRHGLLILALICMYRLSDFVLNLMNPFYQDLGFTLTQIAEVRKIFGVVASVLGIGAGAWCVVRYGILRMMLLGVFASPLSNVVFIWLAMHGPHVPSLYLAIGVDNFFTGFAGTALIVYMSSLTSQGFTAMQYALFSSLYAIIGKIIASQSGRVVEGAARIAEEGGFTAAFRPLFSGLPAGSLARGAEIAGVTPASLGAGYVSFFLYSILIGGVAVVLALVIYRHSRGTARVQA